MRLAHTRVGGRDLAAYLVESDGRCICDSHRRVLAGTAAIAFSCATLAACGRKDWADASLAGILVVTSVLYHGGGHSRAMRALDCTAVRVVFGIALVRTLAARSCTRRRALGAAAVLWIHFAPCTRLTPGGPLCIPWHAAMHICGAAALA